MSFNRFMHPRNPYKNAPPDFKELAASFADFRQHCTLGTNGQVHVNFHEDDAVRSLARAIFMKDFNLDVELPKGCLVPRIPQRLNYLLWIEDVLKRNNLLEHEHVTGIDIGTGASCVYALLGARQLGWKFVATDADELAADTAHRNVVRNSLADSIQVLNVNKEFILKDVFREFSGAEFTFCMCNPPFFESDETDKRFLSDSSTSIVGGASYKNRCGSTNDERAPPRSATLARKNELEVEGGEVAFVGRIINESMLLRSRICIYTSMLGKKCSVAPLKRLLARLPGVRYTVSTLSQGRTQRWVLAWTYSMKIQLEEQTGTSSTSISIADVASVSPSTVNPLVWIRDELEQLDVQVAEQTCEDGTRTLRCDARRCTWTNQRSRRRAEARLVEGPPKEKRMRLSCYDAAVQVCLGEGDGRDSLSDAGNFEYCNSESTQRLEDGRVQHSVAIQAYIPCSSDLVSLLRFRVFLTEHQLVFDYLEGQRNSLFQLLQHLRNRLKPPRSK